MRNGQRAFTLLELLTVIAIIAILSAIIVPVFSRVKDNSYRSQDIANMNSLRSALALYREDQGAYPPALLGYVTLYASGPNAGNVIPASELKGFLAPKRVPLSAMTPSYVRASSTATVNAVFPEPDATAVGNGAQLDLNGDGAITAADDVAGVRQAFGPADGSVCWDPSINAIAAGARCGGVTLNDPADPRARLFYSISGYDVASVPVAGGGTRNELRYTRFWTNFAIGSGAGFGAGNENDDPRQLGYTNPPDETVVTWNSNFREYTTPGVPGAVRRDIVLLLSGAARPWDSKQLFDRAWRQKAN
jgi:prepilin-type N-terminal cleavage/methylation domain-containing protein